jgi:CubicO group peptidase (beta-lactamase class C family)
MFKVLVLAIVLATSSAAQSAEVSAQRASGGMSTEFKNIRILPAAVPSTLLRRDPTAQEIDIVKEAESIARNHPLLSMILVDHGEIIYETYNAPAAPDRPSFSWSMSKSLTAYTLGLMNCDSNNIIDYNQPAENYSKDLAGTVYGEATVRNLMTMTSGVSQAPDAGDHFAKRNNNCTSGTDCTGWDMQRSQKMSGAEYIKAMRARDIKSGQEFRYSATDTLALATIIDKNGGLVEQFDKHIWSKIGAESYGYWLTDKDNKPIAQAGFSAVGRDWARLAMYTIKLKKSGTDCQQQFMNAATTTQIANNSKIGKLHSGYGYQTWISSNGPRESYWWVGHGGQRVAVDSEKERIMIVTSHRESYMKQLNVFFTAWQRN